MSNELSVNHFTSQTGIFTLGTCSLIDPSLPREGPLPNPLLLKTRMSKAAGQEHRKMNELGSVIRHRRVGLHLLCRAGTTVSGQLQRNDYLIFTGCNFSFVGRLFANIASPIVSDKLCPNLLLHDQTPNIGNV